MENKNNTDFIDILSGIELNNENDILENISKDLNNTDILNNIEDIINTENKKIN